MADNTRIKEKMKELITSKLTSMSSKVSDNKLYKEHMSLKSPPPPLSEMSHCRCIFVSSERQDRDKKTLRPLYLANGPFNVLVFKEFICKHDAGMVASLGCVKGATSSPFINRFVSSSFIYMSFVDVYYSILDTIVVNDIKYFIVYSTPQQARTMRVDGAELHWLHKNDSITMPQSEAGIDLIAATTMDEINKKTTEKINNMMTFEFVTLYAALAVTIAYLVYYFKIDIKTAFTESKSVYSAVKQIRNDHNSREDERFAKEARSRAFHASQDKAEYAKIQQGNAAIEAEYAALAPSSR